MGGVILQPKSDLLRCDCGAQPATVVPVPMCSSCARAYYVVLVSIATTPRPLETLETVALEVEQLKDQIIRDFMST